MLGFGRKEKASASIAEQIVDELQAEFDAWTDAQRLGFAEIILRIVPALATQAGGLEALPLGRVGAVLKRGALRLLPKLALNREGVMQELREAFFTRGQRMREFCAGVAKRMTAVAEATAANDNGQAAAKDSGPTLAPGIR